MIDESTAFGARVARHLREDVVVWLTTVSPGGVPQPSPVWFLWDGASTVRVYSVGGTPRTRNLLANPNVSLNFGGDGQGGDIVVLTGSALVDASLPPADAEQDYLAKYTGGIAGIGMTPATFAGKYDQPVVITLTGVRGF